MGSMNELLLIDREKMAETIHFLFCDPSCKLLADHGWDYLVDGILQDCSTGVNRDAAMSELGRGLINRHLSHQRDLPKSPNIGELTDLILDGAAKEQQ